MNTNIKIELDDEQRRKIARVLFGSNKPITRKELTTAVGMMVDNLLSQDESPVTPRSAPTASEVRGCDDRIRSAAGAKQPNDASYMRGWNAVGVALRRMKL